jgi:hypothetical protein
VQPSSLVFVAIVVGWAAYLLPQWLRRRETLSQSRGTDRHSTGLRVLDRRTRVASGPSSTPLLPDPRTIGAVSAPPSEIADRRVEDPAGRRGGHSPRQPNSTAVGGLPASARTAARRRVRVLTVLLTLTGMAWVASVWVPVATAMAVGVSVLLGFDVLALLVAARRREVRRAAAARARRRELERRKAARARQAPARPAVTTAGGEVSTGAEDVTAEASSRPVVEAPAERVARELPEGGTPWVPVPVPPPTYTLKPAAPRPEPAPLDLPLPSRPTDPAGQVEVDPEPAARTPRPWEADRTFADDLDLDAVLARRRAANG